VSAHPLSRALDRATGARPIPGNSLRHLPDSAKALDVMVELIAGAKRSIHFENFIVRDDRTGRRFADAWAERARAGVQVRVLYDSLGCRGTGGGYWRELRRAGVDVRAFRPVWTSGIIDALTRDHRKILVVDGVSALTGGLCVGDEWAGDAATRKRPWRDTMVLVQGPAVAALDATFARMWARAGDPLPTDEIADRAPECGPSAVRVIEGVPGQSRIYRAVLLLAAAVTERLWITDAYLVAPPPLYAGLVDAARSGVDVRFLLPGTSDIPIVRTLSRGGYRELLHAGARIFEYRGPMLHAKTILADHEWVRIGSSNLNVSSLLGNYELDVVAEGDALTDTLAGQFLHDMGESREIVLQARRRLLPPRLVDTAAIAPPAPGPAPAATGLAAPVPEPSSSQPVRRTRRELQAAAAVAFVQVAGGAWRMLAGAAALMLAVLAALLVVFPTVTGAVLAVVAAGSSLGFAGFALARRRRRRESDAR
jgi:cardiolipin synthase